MLSLKRKVIIPFATALVLSPLILGCGKKEAAARPSPAPPTPSATSPAPAPASAARPAEAAAPAASVSAEPMASPPGGEGVLATQDYNEDPNLKCDVLQVKRVSGGTLLIKWRLAHRGPQGSKSMPHRFSWSDVYFTDPGENKKYLGLKDSAGSWLGQGDNKNYNPGDQQVIWLKFPAPPANSAKITFVFPGFPPFEDLPVSP
ncbi:MAG TPA: hypothetical protein VGS00_05770 [Thermoanaerobaculia bacterium]|nr:hypothetical protein [Thermoanaerobaculia bacterium]